MGYLKKRSTKSWTLWYYTTNPVTGERVRRTKTVKGTKKKAEEELRRLEYMNDQGVDEQASERITVAQYLDTWLETYVEPNLRKNTYNGYKAIARDFCKHIGQDRLDQVQPLRIQGIYTAWLHKGLSPTTVVRRHRMFKTALKHAINWGILDRNPLDRVQLPRLQRKPPTPMTIEQANVLLEVAKGHWYYAALVVAIYTGMRRGEIIALKWEQVELDARQIEVVATVDNLLNANDITLAPPKTQQANRKLPLSQFVVATLREHHIEQLKARVMAGQSWNDQGMVFPTETGQLRHPQSLTFAFRLALKRSGLPLSFRLHDLRHTHASLLLALGVELPVVAARLGHASTAITSAIYAHQVEGRQQQAADAFGEAMESGS